ncbi:lactoylglutathione lyase [Leptospira levettii]|uniref:VOC family protein n=1 Tax=Leptospira levettii TaxID=2023178 RepID=UPI001083B30B|nr:VOC family protein [Leptospira levettii]TGL25837.1 lactoylglutathione lyase [Leptospira levettii]
MNPIIKSEGIIQIGIITEKLIESKEFFQKWLGWRVKFESEWFLLLSHPEKEEREIAFMLPNQTAVRKSYFQKAYTGQGVWLIIESEEIKTLYEQMVNVGAPIDLPLTKEEWGDLHFTMIDPNGIGLDFVQMRS